MPASDPVTKSVRMHCPAAIAFGMVGLPKIRSSS
jgi:hypothetical protein